MIAFESVSKSYGSRLALDDFSLQIAPGEVVALVGPNGAGKSTAIRMVVGIVRPSAGTIRVNGYTVAAQPEAARTLVGYVPQRFAFPDHVAVGDLVRLVAALRCAPVSAAAAALGAVNLTDRGRSLVRDLSGGQRQRLSLALALIGQPRALVLDEPSISLDADGAAVVSRTIAGARERGAAILFASHHLHEVAALADRLVVLQYGRITAARDARSLRDPAALQAFYRGALRREDADAA